MEMINHAPSCTPSVPVVIETFTSSALGANRDVALAWRESVHQLQTMKILPGELRDLEESWTYSRRTDLHKLPAADVTRFTIMKRSRILKARAAELPRAEKELET